MRKLKQYRSSRVEIARHRLCLRELPGITDTHPTIAASNADDKNRLSVCFTGHRALAAADIPVVTQRLDALLLRCYAHGYRDFYCGGALGFDTIAGERVVALKRQHPDVRLIMVLPCGDQARYWPSSAIPRYERLLYMADGIRVLAPTYYEGCMQARNRYMVDHAQLCICYLRYQKGGTASTVAYAIRQRVPVLNVAMQDAGEAFPEG